MLEAIGTSGLLAHMAAMAPLGVIAPAIMYGLVAAEPVALNGAGGAIMPPSVAHVLSSNHHARCVASADRGERHRSNWPTETLSGCPVAARGPRRQPDGSIDLYPLPALRELSRAFIDVVRTCLQRG